MPSPAGLGLPWSGAWAWPAFVLVGVFALYALALLTGRGSRWLPGLSRLRRLTLRTHLTLAIAFIAVVPGLALAVYLVESGAATAEARSRQLLAAATDAAARSLERRLLAYQRGLAEFAKVLALSDPEDRIALLDAHLDTDGDFLTMLVADQAGRVIAARANPRVFGGRDLPASLDVADRDYFQVPMREGRSYLSGVFQGRGFGAHRIVALSTPIVVQDRSIGVVQGAYAVDTIERLRGVVPMDPDAELLVLDREGGVIHASTAWTAGTAEREALIRLAADPGQVVRTPGAPPWYIVSAQRNALGWTTAIRVPLAAIASQVREQTPGILTALLVWALLSLLLGWWLARSIALPVGRLAEALGDFDPTHPSPSLGRLPRFAPRELRELRAGLARSRRRLRSSYHALREALDQEARLRRALDITLAEREAVIRDRTQELADRTGELERANQLLTDLARKDGLTGIPNQRAFHEYLDFAWRAASRMRQPVTLLLIDVDHFKAYNDRHGHPAGDVCLQRVAAALHGLVNRSMDFVGRCGGEEFAMVLGATWHAGGRVVAEQARLAVEGLAIPHGDSSVGPVVTISVGVATFSPDGQTEAATLLHLADAALYEAKRAGRNRVCAVD